MTFEKIIIFIINFFDNYKTKKIFKFLNKKIIENPLVFDVGAHHGESIKLIKNYLTNPRIFSFEISKKNFSNLEKKVKKKNYLNVQIYNHGFSDKETEEIYFQSKESSSTTISKINSESKYLKKKLFILGNKKLNDFFIQNTCKVKTIKSFVLENNIKKIDLLKIDTEGHEYKVLIGCYEFISQIKFILFEHHYDDMILKEYKYSNIHNFLIQNKFKKIYKSKMFFRKTFEYIYENYTI